MPGGRTKAVRSIENTPLEGPMSIPCHKGHTHTWPTEGPITMQDVGRCQVYCQFCSTNIINPVRVEAKWGWYLRRHIYQVHRKDFPDLIVPEEWSGSKKTSKGKVGPTKGEAAKVSKKSAKKTAKKTAEVASMLPIMPNPPAGEFDFATYGLEHAAQVSDTYHFDQLFASETDSVVPDRSASVDWNDLSLGSYFNEPTCADPFVQGAPDPTLCDIGVLEELFDFEDYCNVL